MQFQQFSKRKWYSKLPDELLKGMFTETLNVYMTVCALSQHDGLTPVY